MENEPVDYIVIKQIRIQASSAEEAISNHSKGATIGISAGIDKNSPKASSQNHGQ